MGQTYYQNRQKQVLVFWGQFCPLETVQAGNRGRLLDTHSSVSRIDASIITSNEASHCASRM